MREINSPAEMAELMKECVASVKFYIDKAKERCSVYLAYPRVLFSLKGTTAGKALCGRGVIEFSPTLLRENPDTFLVQTAGHEVAHLVAWQKHLGKLKPHGVEWQAVMWNLGLPANRCHNYDTSRVESRVGLIRKVAPEIRTDNLRMKPIGLGKIIGFD